MSAYNTPSDWHDSARIRDAGHDQMQVELLRYLESKKDVTVLYKGREFQRSWWGVEFPITIDGRIRAFADAAEIFRCDHIDPNAFGQAKRDYIYRLFEIKPRIDSCGAVIRQCKAIQHLMEQWRARNSSHEPPAVIVIPVVMLDDPKVALLREMYYGTVWEWADGKPARTS